jgi:predicted nucleic-acid-binding Zn-ribbon protein
VPNENSNDLAGVLGKAIYCNCYVLEFNRHKILGSVTDQGVLEILRGHKNKTTITGISFVIRCPDCGYSEFLNLQSMAVNQPTYVNEN